MRTPRLGLPSRFWAIAGATVALDWLTKWVAHSRLLPGAPHDVLGSLVRITLAYDPRRTFWLGIPGTPHVRPIGGLPGYWLVKILVLAVILRVASRAPRAPRAYTIGFGIVFGGGVANTGEQFLRGTVVNFLDVGVGAHRWPTFNVADACLVTGSLLLVALMLRDHVRERGWWGLVRAQHALPPSFRRRDGG